MKLSDRKRFTCLNCKKDVWDEYYMLNTRVWKKANPKIEGMLCIDCVEEKLARKLTKKDFTKALLNTMKMKRTPRLRSRLLN